ncbi:alpha/beta hydrolase [Ammoniphilus sp. CFH 90114]|uniref:alpha/beta hydrolase n=1 Tax=Ammoniphilus sp. CFH 90114 TaxID=2493665 RepID=UPI00100FE0F2|nr:alpha/beta hydrolase [Ammoniphilus sp. CFH 90114]RXT05826.1 alpha/beta fold hydrolase [Ammoniphilus sp. CFH 90114]
MKTFTFFSPGSEPVWGSVLLVHGSGEHVGAYKWAVDQWNQAGLDVWGGDLPGHGQSPGKRGHIHQFDDYIDAVDTWYEAFRRKSHHLPFIFGHSLGGLVVSRFMEVKKREASGVILSSPCFALKVRVPAWKEWIAKSLNVFYPSLVLPSEVTTEAVTRNIETRRIIENDPLRVKGVSVRWYRELQVHMQRNWEEKVLFPDVPIAIHQAGQDLIIDSSAPKKWIDNVQLTDKEFTLWPGLYHELLSEPERQEVMDAMVKWMKERRP